MLPRYLREKTLVFRGVCGVPEEYSRAPFLLFKTAIERDCTEREQTMAARLDGVLGLLRMSKSPVSWDRDEGTCGHFPPDPR